MATVTSRPPGLRGYDARWSDSTGTALVGPDGTPVLLYPGALPLRPAPNYLGYPASDGTLPVAILDFENSYFYWGGEVKSLSDLTAGASGDYYIDDSLGLTTGEVTAVIEYTPTPEDGQFTGTVLSWTTGYPAGNRFEFGVVDIPTYGDGLRVYLSPGTPSANYAALPQHSIVAEAGARYMVNARVRRVIAMEAGQPVRSTCQNSALHSYATYVPTSIGTPTRIAFGSRAYASAAPDLPLAGATLHKVILFDAALSDALVEDLAAAGRKPPIHLLGDSFLNLYITTSGIEQLLGPSGYVPISQDGVGSTSSTQQAVRYASTTKWHDSTLVWCDMGLDGTWLDWLAAANSVTSNLSHDRFLIVEPAPNQDAGTAGRATFDAFVANMQAWAGPRWVPTLAAAMALSTGSAQDVAKVANLRWPTSITASEGDFHPNALGYAMLAELIHTKLTQMGWA